MLVKAGLKCQGSFYKCIRDLENSTEGTPSIYFIFIFKNRLTEPNKFKSTTAFQQSQPQQQRSFDLRHDLKSDLKHI